MNAALSPGSTPPRKKFAVKGRMRTGHGHITTGVGGDDVSYRRAVLREHPAVGPRTPITNPPRRRMSEQVVTLRACDAEGRR